MAQDPDPQGPREPVELDTLRSDPGTAGAKPAIVPPGSKPYNPAEDREKKRGQIATRLVGLLIAVSLAPFVVILVRGTCVAFEASEVLASGSCTGFGEVNLMDVMQLVLTAVVALVGAATGFYFGEKSGGDGGR